MKLCLSKKTMQAAESSSSSKRRHPYNEEDDKLDKLAESSAQASVRRLSTSNNIDNQASQRRNTSMSTTTTTNGIDKGKSRLLEEQEKDHDARENEDMNAEDSEVSLYESDDDESIHCAICLSVIDDRTIVQPCCHGQYCWLAYPLISSYLRLTDYAIHLGQTPTASYAFLPGLSNHDAVHFVLPISSF